MIATLLVITLILYTVFSFNPVAAIPLLGRTLNMSPGDLFTMLLAVTFLVKNLIQGTKQEGEPRLAAVKDFLYAYIFLAAIFLIATVQFFLLHNEFAFSLGRSLFNYLLWCIPLVLFYCSSEMSLELKKVHSIVRLLMTTFVLGVLGNIIILRSAGDILKLFTETFQSDQMRLGGQVGDPNQLGALAAFFSGIGIMGVFREPHYSGKLAYLAVTLGTGLILLLTQSRESIAALAIALLVMVVFLLRDRQYGKAITSLAGLAAGGTLVLLKVPRIVETITAMVAGDTKYALSDREHVWTTAWRIISDYPFGIGFENMYLLTNNAVQQAHNAFLQSAILAGYIGFFAFLIFLLCLSRMLLTKKKHTGNWLLEAYFAFLVGYLVTAFGSDHFISFYTFNAIFFGLLGFVSRAR